MELVQTRNVGSKSLKTRRLNKTKKKQEEYCKTLTSTNYSTLRTRVVTSNAMLNPLMKAAAARRRVTGTILRRMAAKTSSVSPQQIKHIIGGSTESMMKMNWAS